MDEIFFFIYHMNMDKFSAMRLEIPERRYLIDKFVEQKKREKEEHDKEARKAKSQARSRR
jgi:hypothetical protein